MAKTSKKQENSSGNAVIGDMLSDEQRKLLADAVIENATPMAATPSESLKESLRAADRVITYQEQQQNEATIGHNNPPNADLAGILDHYKFRKSSTEAITDLSVVASEISTTQNELEGPLVARLSLDLADIAFDALAKGKLTMPAVSDENDFRERLCRYVKSNELLGKPIQLVNPGETLKILGPDKKTVARKSTAVVVDTVNPYSGSMWQTLMVASTRACLLLKGHASKAEVGYLRRTEGTGQRFSKAKVWSRQRDILTEDIDGFFSAICIPFNVVYPNAYVPIRIDNKTERLQPITDMLTEDDTLRYCGNDWAEALYLHYYKGVPCSYDVEGKKATGLLVKPSAKRATAGTQSEKTTGSDTSKFAPEAQKHIKELEKKHKTELEKVTTAKFDGGNLASSQVWDVQDSLTKLIADRTKPFSDRAFVSVFKMADTAVLMRLARYADKMPPREIGELAVNLIEHLSLYVEYNKDGDHFWIGKEGKPIGKIGEDDAAAKAA